MRAPMTAKRARQIATYINSELTGLSGCGFSSLLDSGSLLLYIDTRRGMTNLGSFDRPRFLRCQGEAN